MVVQHNKQRILCSCIFATALSSTLLPYANALQSSPLIVTTTSNNLHQPSSSRLYLGDFFNFGGDNKDKQKKTSNTAAPQEVEQEEPPQTAATTDGAYDADDPVEKIFSFFFGEREAAPMGMKRMTKDQFPERYPATKTEWADPVSSDDAEMASIRIWKNGRSS